MHCSLQHSSTIVVADCLFNRKPCRSLLLEKEKNFEASSLLSPIWCLWPTPVRYKRLSFQYILGAIIILDVSQYLCSTGDTIFYGTCRSFFVFNDPFPEKRNLFLSNSFICLRIIPGLSWYKAIFIQPRFHVKGKKSCWEEIKGR